VDSLLEFLRYLLDLEGLPAYQDIVTRQPFNADQIRFLRVVQNVFLQKRRLELADLYEPPLTRFGADAVERWFTEDRVNELLTFIETLRVFRNP
jgi:type I restriction enzyme R subunit